jgi:hypothetical protein
MPTLWGVLNKEAAVVLILTREGNHRRNMCVVLTVVYGYAI